MRALLIEDDPTTAQSVELALTSEGIICDRAENVQRTVSRLISPAVQV